MNILVSSHFDIAEKQPLVVVIVNDKEFRFSVAEARDNANSLFLVVGIAESEAAVFKAYGKSGFERNPKNPGIEALKKVRKHRCDLPKGLSVGFGFNRLASFVEISWYGEAIQLSTEEATQHGFSLLEAAEAATYDAFLLRFLEDELTIEAFESIPILHKFQTYRNQNILE